MEILNCPCCGDEGQLICGAEDKYCIECENITSCSLSTASYKTEQEAIEVWNKRSPAWIDVREKLPRHGQRVLCRCLEIKNVLVCWHIMFGEHGGVFQLCHSGDGNALLCNNVTHWMAMPEIPD